MQESSRAQCPYVKLHIRALTCPTAPKAEWHYAVCSTHSGEKSHQTMPNGFVLLRAADLPIGSKPLPYRSAIMEIGVHLLGGYVVHAQHGQAVVKYLLIKAPNRNDAVRD